MLIVDSNEPPIIRAWANEQGHPVQRLPFGDFWYRRDNYWLSIQRKTISDLVASVKDGRLEKDLRKGLQEERCDIALLIEGTFSVWKDGYVHLGKRNSGISAQQMFSGLLDLWRYDVGIIWQPQNDPLTTCRLLGKLYEDINDPEHVTSLLTRSRGRKKGLWRGPSPQEQAIVNLQIDGLGPGKAVAAMGNLTLLEFLSLPYDELIKRPGVGPKLAKQIRTLCDGTVSESTR
jgi:ERCC4-type nuclease